MSKFIEEYKVQIVGIIGAILLFLVGRGYIPQDITDLVATIFGICGLSITPIQTKVKAYALARSKARAKK